MGICVREGRTAGPSTARRDRSAAPNDKGRVATCIKSRQIGWTEKEAAGLPLRFHGMPGKAGGQKRERVKYMDICVREGRTAGPSTARRDRSAALGMTSGGW